MKYLSSWSGFLARAVVEPEKNVGGLGAWEVTDILRLWQGQEYPLAQRDLPYRIPHPECHFAVRLQAAIAGQPGARAADIVENLEAALEQFRGICEELGGE